MSETLRFLAGGEVECLFIDPNDEVLMGRARERAHYTLLNEEYSLTPEPLHDVQSDAIAMLNALQPSSDAEAVQLESWKRQVPDFNAVDAVNFRLYQGASRPTLNFKQSTLGMSYSQLANLHGGPLEFRFGKDELQQGYYDNPHVSEVRITPCPPREYSRRRAWLLRTMGHTAASLGMYAFAAKEDVSVSAFDGEAPLLGDPRTNIRPYQAAVLGMQRRYRADRLAYVRYEKEEEFLNISPWRQAKVRMLPGRFEHRRALFCDNTVNLLVDGMTHGFTEAIDEDIDQVPVGHVLATTPAEGFERTRDLGLMRAVGRMVLTPDGIWRPESGMWTSDFINTVFAEQDIRDYGSTIMHYMERNSLFVVRDGYLQLDMTAIPAVEQALPDGARQYYASRQFDYCAAQKRLRRIRVEQVPTIIWRNRSVIVS